MFAGFCMAPPTRIRVLDQQWQFQILWKLANFRHKATMSRTNSVETVEPSRVRQWLFGELHEMDTQTHGVRDPEEYEVVGVDGVLLVLTEMSDLVRSILLIKLLSDNLATIFEQGWWYSWQRNGSYSYVLPGVNNKMPFDTLCLILSYSNNPRIT